MTVIGRELPEKLMAFLKGGECTVIATATATGELYTAIMTWVVAKDSKRVRVAMEQKGKVLANVRENPRVALEVLGNDLNMAVRGSARVIKERMEAAPFPCTIVELEVEEVSDHSVADIIFIGPSYKFIPGKEEYALIEEKVFAELRES